MADMPDAPENNEEDQSQPIKRMPLLIHTQYIKDLSFENPKAPQSFKGGQGQPQMDVSFSINARDIPEAKNTYEVLLGVEAKAVRDNEVLFLVELEYAGVVSLENVPEGRKHSLLMIEVPRYLFPFARQIIADLTQQAGYMPLLLNSVNFRQLYMERFGIKDGGAQSAESEETEEESQAVEA